MIDLTYARPVALAVHQVGNKIRQEDLVMSPNLHPVDDDSQLIEDFLLSPMRGEKWYKFKDDPHGNEVYEMAKEVLQARTPEVLLKYSQYIAEVLYSRSTHPHIAAGELYVCLFREAVADHQECYALGIFKAEKKDLFVKTDKEEDHMRIDFQHGLPLNGLHKGCLIFDLFADDGYNVLIYDRNSSDAAFWRDDFLKLERVEDAIHTTQQTMEFAAQFGDEVVDRDFGGTLGKQRYFSDCLDYFTHNKEFDPEEFLDDVPRGPEMRDAMAEFFGVVGEEVGFELETFAISKQAVKEMSKRFKPVIKLDTQVTLTMHKKHADFALDHIEQGYDEERGQHFYKVYYNEEVE